MRSHTIWDYPFSLTVELDGGPLDISDLLREPSPAAPGSASIRCLDLHEARRTIRLEERARELAKGRRSGGNLVGSFASITQAAEHLVEQYAIDHAHYWIECRDDRCSPERWLVMRGNRP